MDLMISTTFDLRSIISTVATIQTISGGDTKIFMNNNIPYSGNLAPGYFRMLFSNFFGQVFYGFSNNFQSSKHGILFLNIAIKLIFGNSVKKFLDMFNTL